MDFFGMNFAKHLKDGKEYYLLFPPSATYEDIHLVVSEMAPLILEAQANSKAQQDKLKAEQEAALVEAEVVNAPVSELTD